MRIGWHGIYPALSTPVDETGSLDEASLRAEVQWAIDKGAHGVIASIVAGEFYKFTDQERIRTYEITVKAAKGRVPVLAGVSHTGTEAAVALALHAKDVGADGIVVMPPWFDADESRISLYEHYATVARRVDIPIMIQDYEPVGPAMTAPFFKGLIDDFDNIVSVKLEGEGSWQKLLDLSSLTDEVAIFGGMAARNLYDELKAGAHGNIPDACCVDLLVDVYELFRQGRETAAAESFNRYTPWLDYLTEHMTSWAEVEKETLRQRHVIRTSHARLPKGPDLSSEDKKQLSQILKQINLD